MALTALVICAVLASAAGTRFRGAGAPQATTGAVAVHLSANVNATQLRKGCVLPSGARWCSVNNGGAPWMIAAYSVGDIVSNMICTTGRWDMEPVAAFGTPGLALDIGGNIGYNAFTLAQAGWWVHSFEPMDLNVQMMQATACQNPELAKRIQIHHLGLGAADEECELISNNSNQGDGLTRCGAQLGPAPAGYSVRQRFAIQRLDNVLAAWKVGQIQLVKMDVEGFECKVLEGGQSLLTWYKPRLIQSEIFPQHDFQGCTIQEYLMRYQNAGYTVAKDIHCAVPTMIHSGGIEEFYMCLPNT